MKDIVLYANDKRGLSKFSIEAAIKKFISESDLPQRTLLIPPDFTRMHSGAGMISQMLYKEIGDRSHVDLMPALGTHEPVSDIQRETFFGTDIPKERFLDHNWREDVMKVGVVPKEFVSEVSEGIVNESFDVEVNRALVEGGYGKIISIGQVVPHEVIGMANYTKNILVGVGGSGFINKSHMLGALYGMERIMGRDGTPVRRVFDYAQENFLSKLPIVYILTVTTNDEDGLKIHGLFIGDNRSVFEKAVKLAQEKNMTFVDEPFKKCVVWLDEEEFQSTWLGNKAVYRTRMAMADDGELIILAPGVRHFGEDDTNDALIRKYGYIGRENILKLFATEKDLQENQGVAAHLVHGSSDGRFSITYATRHLSREEVEGAGFKYMPLDEALKIYDPEKLKNGINKMDSGEEIFYIGNPALGLWADKKKF